MISGQGLSWKGFKRGARHAWKQHLKPVFAPLIKKGVHAGVNVLTGAAATAMGAPEAAPFAANLLNKGADRIANKIGAYGFRKGGYRRRTITGGCVECGGGCGGHGHGGETPILKDPRHPTHQWHDTRFRSPMMPMIVGGSFLAV